MRRSSASLQLSSIAQVSKNVLMCLNRDARIACLCQAFSKNVFLSVLAEDAIKAALSDYRLKQDKNRTEDKESVQAKN